MAKRPIIIGRTEHIALHELGFERVAAKIDTGAYRSALHYQRVHEAVVEGQRRLVVVFQMGRKRRAMQFKQYERVQVKSSNGEVSERYLVRTRVTLNGHSVRTQFTLFDRSDMKFQVLLGRKFLRHRFLVDVSRTFVLDP
ncbi:MAG: ATP-dependent zinc protease [Flavobacteriales bacterium]|nr:ATP-dependent zinc protease [Flavobacteriales bacterium]